jgi:hypothetical protein
MTQLNHPPLSLNGILIFKSKKNIEIIVNLMLKFVTLSFFISLFALSGCNKEINEVTLTSTDKNQIFN